MEIIIFLIPIALLLGLGGLVFFFWSVKTGQFDDLDYPAVKILFNEDDDLIP